jgi:glycosyltransferase involved in cell wall biosynthesis
MRSWTTLVAADRVIFNSHHHRDVVARALPALAQAMPDDVADLDSDRVLGHAEIVPVGVDVARFGRGDGDAATATGPPLVLWAHRWDDDKRPEVFVRTSARLAAAGVEHRVALLGADGWDGDRRRAEAGARLGDGVAIAGEVDPDTYRRVLREADIVVSVAAHEFFGVAMVEAIAAGCVPVLPHALSYPEVIPAAYHDAVLYRGETFGQRLRDVLADVDGARAAVAGLDAEMSRRYGWPVVAPQLDAALDRAASGVR